MVAPCKFQSQMAVEQTGGSLVTYKTGVCHCPFLFSQLITPFNARTSITILVHFFKCPRLTPHGSCGRVHAAGFMFHIIHAKARINWEFRVW